MKLTHILSLLTIFSVLFNLSMSESKHYFEGVIEYDINYDVYTSRFTLEEVQEREGVKMVILFRKGEWLRKFYNAKGEVMSERFLDLKEKKSYHWYNYANDIRWFDITKDESPLTYSITGEDQILGYDCTKLKSISTNPDHKLIAEFSYANDLHTNPNWYSDYKDGQFNKIAAEVGSVIYLKMVVKAEYFGGTYTATKVTHRKIKNKELAFDKTRLPLRRY